MVLEDPCSPFNHHEKLDADSARQGDANSAWKSFSVLIHELHIIIGNPKDNASGCRSTATDHKQSSVLARWVVVHSGSQGVSLVHKGLRRTSFPQRQLALDLCTSYSGLLKAQGEFGTCRTQERLARRSERASQRQHWLIGLGGSCLAVGSLKKLHFPLRFY